MFIHITQQLKQKNSRFVPVTHFVFQGATMSTTNMRCSLVVVICFFIFENVLNVHGWIIPSMTRFNGADSQQIYKRRQLLHPMTSIITTDDSHGTVSPFLSSHQHTTTLLKGSSSSSWQNNEDDESSSSSSSNNNNHNNKKKNSADYEMENNKIDVPMNINNDKMTEEERMINVRLIQESFYKTASSSQMNIVSTALEEECNRNYNEIDAMSSSVSASEDDVDECIILDTDSPESIIQLNEILSSQQQSNTNNDNTDTNHQRIAKTFAQKQKEENQYDPNTGMVYNLPLWRVPWTEVPFRTNILSVNEPMYTNMFEEIIRSSSLLSSATSTTISDMQIPLYVGHLYLPGGSSSLQKPKPVLVYATKDESTSVSTTQESSATNITSSTNPSTLETEKPKKKKDMSIVDPLVELQAWNEQEEALLEQSNHVEDHEKSATIGTLLKIVDYRRLQDGKLLLFVQALYRFVVVDVKQTFPYGVATVQLLPDLEEYSTYCDTSIINTANNNNNVDDGMIIQSDSTNNRSAQNPLSLLSLSEQRMSHARAVAAKASFQCWHQYEFDKTKLSLKQDSYIPITDVIGTSIAKLIPFAYFSKDNSVLSTAIQIQLQQRFEENNKIQRPIDTQSRSVDNSQQGTNNSENNDDESILSQGCLEQQLYQAGILKEPFIFQKDFSMQSSIDDIEVRLWLTLNDYAKNTRAQIPLVLLELLPHNIVWPKLFILQNIVSVMEKLSSTSSLSTSASSSGINSKFDSTGSSSSSTTSTTGSKITYQEGSAPFSRISTNYPSIRRQQRLSYHAAQLLEKTMNNDEKNILRQQLLQIPTIKSRLIFISQQFEKQEHAFE